MSVTAGFLKILVGITKTGADAALGFAKFTVNAAVGGIIEEAVENIFEHFADKTWAYRTVAKSRTELTEAILALAESGGTDALLGAMTEADHALAKELESKLSSAEDKVAVCKEFFKKEFGPKLRRWFRDTAKIQEENFRYFTPEELYTELYSERDRNGTVTLRRVYCEGEAGSALLLAIAEKINLLYFEMKYKSLAAEERDVIAITRELMAMQSNALFDRLRDFLEVIIQQNAQISFVCHTEGGTLSPEARKKTTADLVTEHAKKDPFFFVPLKCPNCESHNVTRTGDTVVCKSCGHKYLAIENVQDDDLHKKIDELTAELRRKLAAQEGYSEKILERVEELAKQQASAEFVKQALNESEDAVKIALGEAEQAVHLDITEAADTIERAIADRAGHIEEKIDDVISEVRAVVSGELHDNLQDMLKLLREKCDSMTQDLSPRLPERPWRLCPMCESERYFKKRDVDYCCEYCKYPIPFAEIFHHHPLSDEKLHLELTIEPWGDYHTISLPALPGGARSHNWFALHLGSEELAEMHGCLGFNLKGFSHVGKSPTLFITTDLHSATERAAMQTVVKKLEKKLADYHFTIITPWGIIKPSLLGR